MDRRAVLRWGLAGAFGLVLPTGTALLASRGLGGRLSVAKQSPDAVLPPHAFTVPLPIPPVLRPTSTEGGVDRYEVRLREGRLRIVPDRETVIWGYEGIYPGPTIEARRGRPVAVTFRNELTNPSVVHLHGGVVPAASDGYPADLMLPMGAMIDPLWTQHAQHGVAGLATGSRTYHYPNDQPAAMLWYHEHRMDFTGPQLYRGLAGCYIIRDDVEDRLSLPRGDREIPLMIADRTINEDGSLFYPAKDPTLRQPGVTIEYHHSGMLGDTITVNGVAWPVLEVDAALYRFRFINASNARPYELVLDPSPPNARSFIQIGSDVGLLSRPIRYDAFLISPGERYDILIDFSNYPIGTKVMLRNTVGVGAASYVMRFDVVRTATDDPARVPSTLAEETGPPAPAKPRSDRQFSFFSGPEMTGLPPMINLQSFELARIDARPTLNSTEIWDITADPTHPIHLHMAHFRVLSRAGGPPAPHDAGWKDTVFVPEGGVRLAVTFAGYRGKYVFHCHNLEHGDAGMMANMEIV